MTPRTLVDIFRNLADTPKPDLLLSKQGGKWIPISTVEFMDRVKALSSALEGLGVKQGGRVALLSENRPEWSIVDFACQCYGAVLVPIFPTMVADQAAYLLKDSGTTVAFASTPDQAGKILAAQQASPEVKQTLKHVIVFEASSLPGTTPYASVVENGRAADAADPSAFEKRADARQPAAHSPLPPPRLFPRAPPGGPPPGPRPTPPRSRTVRTRASPPTSRPSSTRPERRASRRARCSCRATSSRTSSRPAPSSPSTPPRSPSRSCPSRTSSNEPSNTPTTTGPPRSRTRSRSTSCATTSPR